MKKIRKVLIAVFSVMLLVCMGLFAAACDTASSSTDENGSGTQSEQKVYYTVTVAEYDTAKGSVTLDPAPADGKYEKDAAVTVTATPNSDYDVDSVKANGTALTANSSGKYVFTVTADTTVAVAFKAKTVTPPPSGDTDEKVNLTLSCGDNGTATLDPAPVDGKVAKGTSVKLTVTPAANYEVDSVKVNNTPVELTGSEYTFTADADTTVEVSFKAQLVNLALTCGDNGTATLDPAPVDGKVAKGTSVKLTVTPAANYEVDSVKVNNTPVELTGSEYTFTADADTTVEVGFKAQLVSVTLNYDAKGGSVTCDPALADGKVAKGTSVKLTVTPAQYYDLESVKVNNAEVQPADGVYTFTADADTTVDVTFKVQTASVKVTCGDNGTATLDPEPDTDGKIAKGTSAKLTLTPASDPDQYIVNTVILKSGAEDEGTDVTADLVGNEYTFVVTGDVELVVSFKKFARVFPSSTYVKTWYCTVKDEGITTELTISVQISSNIVVRENGELVVQGTAYTATLGYTIYAAGLEDTYEIYLLPGLNNKILALTVNGENVTYYIDSQSPASDPNATIDATHSLYDSSWFGGAASMPIKFEDGEVYVDTYQATRIAKSGTDDDLVYTIYVNGGLYELSYTKAGDSLVLHPYGKSTTEDVHYTREVPPEPVLVPQFAGKYSSNDHEVVIDETGNFKFDSGTYKLYQNAGTNNYYFKSNREYTVEFGSSDIKIFNAAADVSWTLRKITDTMQQYLLTVECPNGTFVVSPKNSEMKYWEGSSVTITITPNTHYEVATITVNGTEKTFTNDAGTVKITVTIDQATTVNVTCNELEDENLLSEQYRGVYTNYSVTVTITADGVTVKGGSVNVTFTADQITTSGTNQFTLTGTFKNVTRTFTIIMNENGTMTLKDTKWALTQNGNTFTLPKQS